MAKNNVQNVRFLRNGSLYTTREEALTKLNSQNLAAEQDGSIILARYGSGNTVKTLVGLVYVNGENKSLTIFDIEGASGDVENLRQEINAKLGDGIKSDNTATAQLTALSGSASDTSATTSVWGAKKYADGLKNAMDYTGLTADENKVVYNVTEADGIVAAEAKNISSVKLAGYAVGSDDKIAATDTLGEALGKLQGQINGMDLTVVSGNGEVITAVSEEDGKVSASKTAIKDVKLTGYVKNTTATGAISRNDDIEDALSKLENTIGSNAITNADGSITVTNDSTTDVKVHIKSGENLIKLDGKGGGIYTNLNLVEITDETALPAEIKVRYELHDSYGVKIGKSIDIPKDSHIVSITYNESTQKLVYTYIDVEGKNKTTEIDLSQLILETEFASGVTFSNGVAHGVVDSTSEKDSSKKSFLTVGADGFKVDGIKGEIDTKINALNATVGSTDVEGGKHVAVQVVEDVGKLTALTVTETDIASKSLLDGLSGKTVTEVASSNNSIEATLSDAADKTKHLDIITDASKIKMSGFTKADAFTKITESSSVTDALLEVDKVITEKAEVISTALNGLEATKAEKTALDAEIKARKAVDGQNGDTYAANTNVNYIGNAKSLNDADIKLDAALKALDDKINNITIDCGTY